MIPSFFCDTCGAANRPQAVFCSTCGRPMHPSAAGTGSGTSGTLTGLLTQQHMLNQRYRILGQIGKGGFGAVYRAADTQFSNRLLAIKEMSQSGLSSQELIEATSAFKHEAFLLASLTHPNLPRIYEQFHDKGRWYLVMDFIEGETLEDYLTRKGGKLPIEQVLDTGIQLCSVLDYLHTRQPAIIFRDLKPANVMMSSNGHIYLIDFGIARHFKPGQAKDTTALGSSGYAAPEQYGKMQTTPRTDMYGLGATLHQLITGNDPSDTPFHFEPLHFKTNPVLAPLETLIMQMLDMDASKRPASIALVRQELQRIAQSYVSVQTNPLPASVSIPLGYQPPAIVATGSKASSRAKAVNIPPQPNTIFICTGHSSRVTAVAWSPNGAWFASTSYDKSVRIWDTNTGKELQKFRGHTDRGNAVAWSPNSAYIASASNDHTVRIWDRAAGKAIFTYGGHSDAVLAVAWSPDGRLIASSSTDKTMQVWEATTGRIISTNRGHSDHVTSVAWSPDGRRIASGGNDRRVQVWEATKDTKRNFFTSLLLSHRGQFTYSGHLGRINAVAWSPDGKRVASVGSDKTMQIWDAFNGRLTFISRHRSFGMNAVAWSPDSRCIATGSNDKTVQVWDAITRNSILTYYGHTGYVNGVTWSPDGTKIASGGVDKTVQVWKVM